MPTKILPSKVLFAKRVMVLATSGDQILYSVHGAHAARMYASGQALLTSSAQKRGRKPVRVVRLPQSVPNYKASRLRSRVNLVGTRYTREEDVHNPAGEVDGHVVQLRGILDDRRAHLFDPEDRHIYRLSVLDCVPGNPNEQYERVCE